MSASFLHLGPDHYLDLENAKSIAKEDVREAWERSYRDLEQALQAHAEEATLYVVFGVQGAGKSTWIRENAANLGRFSIMFDGPLPSVEKRARAISLARRYGVRAVAVWVNTPLQVAMQRNANRTGLAVIKPEAILHVHTALEPPTREEGFEDIIVVGSNGA